MTAVAQFPLIPATTPSPSEIDSKSASGFFNVDHPFLVNASNIPISAYDHYMPNSIDPRQSHTGSPQFNLPDATEHIPWTLGGGRANGISGVATEIAPITRRTSHERGQSTSTVDSAATASPQPQTSRLQGGNRPGSRRSANVQARASSHLQSPGETPLKTGFSQTSSRNASSTSPTKRARMLDTQSNTPSSMRRNLLRSQAGIDDDSRLMSHPGAPVFATSGSEQIALTSGVGFPSQTSRISQAGETDSLDIDAWLEEYLRLGQPLDSMPTVMIPDQGANSFKDEMYLQQDMSRAPANPSYLMPSVPSIVQAANMARSASGSSSQSIPVSPFKPNSQYYGSHLSAMPDDGRDAHDLKYQVSPHIETPTTISPKDAMLEYHPGENETPLFGQAPFNAFTTMPSNPAKAMAYRPEPPMAFPNMGSPVGPWTAALQPPALSGAPMQAFTNYPAPMLPPINPIQATNQGLMSTVQGQAGRGFVKRETNATPEFPAQLISMESSASEAAPPSSGASSSTNLVATTRPNTNADTGTFSCTYHGCLHRFPSAQKLQRHKREAHRKEVNITPGVGSGMSPAQLQERNSQTGPHRCDRINPTTGKPCSAIFSRPYDLTRHEDTIHNSRKQKVRCAICTEEKTFSRADALTRHLRVVHPEVDFPGKHRKRGTRGD